MGGVEFSQHVKNSNVNTFQKTYNMEYFSVNTTKVKEIVNGTPELIEIVKQMNWDESELILNVLSPFLLWKYGTAELQPPKPSAVRWRTTIRFVSLPFSML